MRRRLFVIISQLVRASARTLEARPHQWLYGPQGFYEGLCFYRVSRVIDKILRHCELWKEPAMHPLPVKSIVPKIESGSALDYTYIDQD